MYLHRVLFDLSVFQEAIEMWTNPKKISCCLQIIYFSEQLKKIQDDYKFPSI